MTSAMLFTAVLGFAYMLWREVFARLPLHVDTGFYVSNHTIARRRFAYSKGWNAHYAGCSKLIPELFFSLIYLVHGCPPTGCGGAYKIWSRRYVSIVNYATAIASGLLAAALAGGDARFYYAGLVVYAMLSSEPQYGVYHECAEVFENLAQVLGTVCLVSGLQRGSPGWVCIGLSLWAFDAVFIKLSSAVACVIVAAGVAVSHPESAMTAVLVTAMAAAVYVVWVAVNDQSPWRLAKSLAGHERHFGWTPGVRRLRQRIREKTGCLVRSLVRVPLVPVLAMAGVLVAGHSAVIAWYAAAVLATYFIQAADCRYYVIPVLPLIAILSSFSAGMLASAGVVGVVLLGGVVCAWFVIVPLRAPRRGGDELHARVWRGFRPARDVVRNALIEQVAPTIHARMASIDEKTRNRDLLVYGPLTQAYVLLGTAYDTPIVTPDCHMDDMSPGWQSQLNRRLRERPPAFLLDTDNCFAAGNARDKLGLDYRLVETWTPGLRLFSLCRIGEPVENWPGTSTYMPQSAWMLEDEVARCGMALPPVRAGNDDGPARGSRHGTAQAGTEPADAWSEDPVATRLGNLLNDLHRRGYGSLALYGAGRFTSRYADVYRASPIPVSVVLDDHADRFDGTYLDWPVRAPSETDRGTFDAVLISTDRFTSEMLARIRRTFGRQVSTFHLKA